MNTTDKQQAILTAIRTFNLDGKQPTAEEISKECGLKLESVRSALKRLRAAGRVLSTQAYGRTSAHWSVILS